MRTAALRLMLAMPLQGLVTQTAVQGGVPALRVVVENQRGEPIDLGGNSLWIRVVDEQGSLIFPCPSSAHRGVAEVETLTAGSYWLEVSVAHYGRVVRTISIGTTGTKEEHVQLEPSGSPPGGAVTIGRDRGKLSWSDSNSTGNVTLQLRPVGPDGASLATELVLWAPEGLMDGVTEKFAGPIDFTLGSRGIGRILIRATGFAPTGIDLDFSKDSTLDLGDFVLQPARRVRVRLVAPEGVEIRNVSWEYAARAELALTRRFWGKNSQGNEAELELGAEPFVIGATALTGKEYWTTPQAVLDPSRNDGGVLVLTLQREVDHVIEPTALHEMQEIEVLDPAGLLFLRQVRFLDVPSKLSLIPGRYTMRHRPDGSRGEYVEQPLFVDTASLRLTLER